MKKSIFIYPVRRFMAASEEGRLFSAWNYKTDLPLFQHKNEYYVGSIYVESNWLIENDYTRDIFNYYDYGQSTPKTYILGSVPEPTSGLLILLGTGLLGLRRKIVR